MSFVSSCQVLVTAADLATQLNQTQQATAWANNATALKGRFNEAFWDESAGLYNDNLTTTLHPQDANSLAVVFNLTDSDDKKQRVSEGLQENWNSLGPVPPELPDTISPFISGFEVCHLLLEDQIFSLVHLDCLASSSLHSRRGQARNGPTRENMGLYPIHGPFSSEYTPRGLHGKRITEAGFHQFLTDPLVIRLTAVTATIMDTTTILLILLTVMAGAQAQPPR
jgi:hypothetical protein